MWIDRSIKPVLREQARHFPIVVLTGSRQIGKTSLLEKVFSDYQYVALDVRSHAEMAETRPEDFLRRFPPPLLIDEVQYAPALFRHLKTTVDARRSERGLFVLTGSQNFVLMESVSESLAGRAAVIPFHSLSATEWVSARGTTETPDWPEFLWRGGFPALWSGDDREPSRDRWYQGYLATYLERDVRNLLRVGSLRDFERFLRACAARNAQLLNMSELGRDVGISTPTVKEWLSVLQTSGQVFLLEPYHRSLGKRLVKSPKLYFADSGLAAFLSGYSNAAALWYGSGGNSLQGTGAQAGAWFESFVVGQWLRWRDWHEPSAALWFWRNQSGAEVDLVIELNGKLHPIEVKLTSRPTRADCAGIHRMRALYGDAVATATLACTATETFEVDSAIVARPGWQPWSLG